ncbi:hypothetical protein HNY73_012164 [Argiope bruennichi]|uniref:Uncharacterized protein n=1 Tax=Argiope bruennichi TaxID=94029 RepID=A0A8T0EU24_ARGBR|nr:hypothetical protein HNY73_012164 [Argiope bruennichi]
MPEPSISRGTHRIRCTVIGKVFQGSRYAPLLRFCACPCIFVTDQIEARKTRIYLRRVSGEFKLPMAPELNICRERHMLSSYINDIDIRSPFLVQISAAASPREMSPRENTRPFAHTDSLTNERKTEILQNTRKANSPPDGNNVVENNFFGPSIKRVENYIKKTSARGWRRCEEMPKGRIIEPEVSNCLGYFGKSF